MEYHIPKYQKEIFAGRAEIIAEIIRQAQPRPREQVGRALQIHAERGSGKSFLTMHLHRTVFPGQNICSYLMHLAPMAPSEPTERLIHEGMFLTTGSSVAAELQKILKAVAAWLDVAPAQVRTGTEQELSSWIIDAISKQPAQPYVLICDSAFEADWALLGQLETYLLAPLITFSNVTIIITGRGQPYPFTSAYLRTEVEPLTLNKFSSSETTTLIHNLESVPELSIRQPNADLVYRESNGHPLMTVMRAQGADWEAIVNELLAVAPEAERKDLLTTLVALTPLDGFREEAIEPMLRAYLGAQYPDKWNVKKLDPIVREPLSRLRLIAWKDGKFQIDADLRWALFQYLLEGVDGNTWQRLNETAETLYRGWSKAYPRAAAYFRQQADCYQRQAQTMQLCQ